MLRVHANLGEADQTDRGQCPKYLVSSVALPLIDGAVQTRLLSAYRLIRISGIVSLHVKNRKGPLLLMIALTSDAIRLSMENIDKVGTIENRPIISRRP